MRHMGTSGKFALITAVAALGMLVLTAITLEQAVMATTLGLAALAYVAAVAEVVLRRRRLALLAAGVGSSLTVAFFLAFISTWELAFVDQSTIIGTPLPADDPDDYFFWAAASAAATVLVLLLGVLWPSHKRPGAAGRARPAARNNRPGTRPAKRRPAAGRTPPARPSTRGTAPGGTAQRPSGARAPARLPAAARATAANRPPSSAARKGAPGSGPKPGTASGSRR